MKRTRAPLPSPASCSRFPTSNPFSLVTNISALRVMCVVYHISET